MDKQISSIDLIKNKIIAEAKEYEKTVMAQAKEEAEKISASFEKKAGDSYDRILELGKANADGIISAAQSSQGMRARNALLSVKVELIEKAYDTACEMIGKLPKDEYISLFSGYLAKAYENAKLYEGEIVLFVGKSSPVTCEELSSPSGISVKCGGKNDSFDHGFCLKVGDITLDCSAHTIVSAIKNDTETGVASILFANV